MRIVKSVALVAAGYFIQQEAYAQIQRVDSLKALIPTATNTAQKYGVYFELAYELLDVDNNEAIIYADKAYPLALALGDSFNIVQSGRVRGQLLYRIGRLDEAISQLNDVLGTGKRNDFTKELKYILNALAIAYTHRAAFDKALEANFTLLLLREKEGNESDISLTLNNIGLIYYKMGNFEKAIDYYTRSYSLNKGRDRDSRERTLINIGLCYDEMCEYRKAQEYIYEGLRICGNDCSDNIRMEAALALGNSFLSEGYLASAKRQFLNSLGISLAISDKRFQTYNFFSLAVIYCTISKLDSAEYFLKESECIALTYKYDQTLSGIYEQYLMLYERKGDSKKLSKYQRKFIDLKEKLFGEEQMVNLTNLQIDFQKHENKRTIAFQQQSILLKKKSLRQQYFLNGTLIFLALLLVTLAFLLFKDIQIRKKATRLLTAKIRSRISMLEAKQVLMDRAYKELHNVILITLKDIKDPMSVLKSANQSRSVRERHPKALQYLSNVDRTTRQLTEIIEQTKEPLGRE